MTGLDLDLVEEEAGTRTAALGSGAERTESARESRAPIVASGDGVVGFEVFESGGGGGSEGWLVTWVGWFSGGSVKEAGGG